MGNDENNSTQKYDIRILYITAYYRLSTISLVDTLLSFSIEQQQQQ